MDKDCKVTCFPIILGNSGAIYSTIKLSLLLGINHNAAQSLMLNPSDIVSEPTRVLPMVEVTYSQVVTADNYRQLLDACVVVAVGIW